MYFLSGADIFDGLTWLRFAHTQNNGYTMYKQNYSRSQNFILQMKAHMIDGRCWFNSNHDYIKELELEMRRYLIEANYECFSHHRDLFRSALESVVEAVGV